MLKDHQIAQLVNELRRVAIRHAGTEQLREHISQVVVDALKKAPEPTTTHVYHVAAEMQMGPGVINRFDGVASLKDRIENLEGYFNLKRVVAAQMNGKPHPDDVSVISLSYLGVSNA